MEFRMKLLILITVPVLSCVYMYCQYCRSKLVNQFTILINIIMIIILVFSWWCENYGIHAVSRSIRKKDLVIDYA